MFQNCAVVKKVNLQQNSDTLRPRCAGFMGPWAVSSNHGLTFLPGSRLRRKLLFFGGVLVDEDMVWSEQLSSVMIGAVLPVRGDEFDFGFSAVPARLSLEASTTYIGISMVCCCELTYFSTLITYVQYVLSTDQ